MSWAAKRSSGCRSASKKSGDCRWAARFSSFTSTLATFAVPSSDARSASTVSSARISWNSPLNVRARRPGTRCRAPRPACPHPLRRTQPDRRRDPGKPCRGGGGAGRRNSRTRRYEGRLIVMSKGGAKRIRVGIIGANPDRGWAAQAHIPALRSLAGDFEITALSTSRRESADAASKLFGVPTAFDNHQDLVSNPAVDVVAVTVKVPYHLELATAALEAGKAVYCEWPLGNGLNEAETLAALAQNQGVLAVAGLQGRSAPSVAYVRDLVKQGYVGEVLFTTLVGSGMGWGPTAEPFNAYLNDRKNGATMLSIAVGHTADALCYCLGEVRELSATMAMRRPTFTISETSESRQ